MTDILKQASWVERWLLLVALGHVLIGLLLPFWAYSDGFEHYRSHLQSAFSPAQALPVVATELGRWLVALFGPTVSCVGILMLALVWAGIRSKQTWIWNMLLLAILLWGPMDILISLKQAFWLHLQLDILALFSLVPALLIARKNTLNQ